MLKISFKRERKGLSVIGHVNGPIARDLTMSFFFQEREKDLLNTKSHRVDNVFPKRGKRLVSSGVSRGNLSLSFFYDYPKGRVILSGSLR